MHIADKRLQAHLYKILTVQLLATVLAVIAGFVLGDEHDALGALFGGGIGVTGTLILLWYGRRAIDAGTSLPRNASLVYGSAVVRFAMAIVMFTLGIAVLKLPPLALFGGFILAQLGQMASLIKNSKS